MRYCLQRGPYVPSIPQRMTVCMFGMKPSQILPEYPSKEDFDLEWNKWSAAYTSFRAKHQGLAPTTGAPCRPAEHSLWLSLVQLMLRTFGPTHFC